MSERPEKTEFIVLGGGCFWCVEAVYQRINGIVTVESGYMGGHVAHPTYQQITTGRTGHAEVVRIEFDPETVSLRQLIDLFWEAHDPTTLNRQGADVGPQYRSIIFYYTEEQRQIAEASKAEAAGKFADPIVTFIEPAGEFYEAEGYHQDYYNANPNAGYCRFVIRPKLEKLGLTTKPASAEINKP